jgi:NADPH:quinone reductase-like Zn-dependent oxidoreductase
VNKLNLNAVPLLLVLSLLGAGSASAAAVPTEMQAIVSDGISGPEGLKLETLPVAQPGAGQVLVKVYAASVNPVDWKRYGRPGATPQKVDPLIPGRDIAGVIAKTGPGVTQFKAGDKVFGQVAPLGGVLNGAYAQYAVALVADIAPKPKRMSYAQASGLGIATVTGVRTVFNARVVPGQRVLVTGAAGGVGSAAVQAAKAHGAYVIGTAAGRHAAYLKSIGVDEHVDYTAGDWAARIQNVDTVIDTVSAANATQALQTMKRGGTLVYVAGRPDPAACTAAGIDCQGGALGTMNVAPAAGVAPGAGNPVVEDILRLANAGKLTVIIDASYPLEKAGAAQEENRNGGTQGKIVLLVDAANAGRK